MLGVIKGNVFFFYSEQWISNVKNKMINKIWEYLSAFATFYFGESHVARSADSQLNKGNL